MTSEAMSECSLVCSEGGSVLAPRAEVCVATQVILRPCIPILTLPYSNKVHQVSKQSIAMLHRAARAAVDGIVKRPAAECR